MSKHCNCLDCQERDAEIERFKVEYLKLDEKYEQALRRIENQQSLLIRAADALINPKSERERQGIIGLVSELREAAE